MSNTIARPVPLRIRFLLVAITLVGAAVRVNIAATEAIWRDEAQAVAIASQSFPAGIVRHLVSDGNSPLFYLVEHFAVAPRSAPLRELRDRSVSLLFGIALIPLNFFLCRSLGRDGDAGALVAAMWTAAAPIVVDISTQVRPYGMLITIVALLALCAVRISDGRPAWGGYAVASAAAIYLHTLAAAVVLAFAIALLFLTWSERRFRAWLFTHAAIAILIAPALLLVLRQVTALTNRGRIPWGAETQWSDLPRHYATLLAGSGTGPAHLVVVAVMTGFLILALIIGPRSARLIGGAAILALLVSFALSFRSAAFVARYNSPAGVLMAVAACHAISLVTRRLQLTPAVVIAVICGGAYATYAVSTGYYISGSRSSSRDAASLVQQFGTRDDSVIIFPDTLAVAINYYLPAGYRQIDPPSLTRTEIVDFRGWANRFTERSRLAGIQSWLAATRAERRRAWLILWLPTPEQMFAGLEGNSVLPRQWQFGSDLVVAYRNHYREARPPLTLRSREGCVVTLGVPR